MQTRVKASNEKRKFSKSCVEDDHPTLSVIEMRSPFAPSGCSSMNVASTDLNESQYIPLLWCEPFRSAVTTGTREISESFALSMIRFHCNVNSAVSLIRQIYLGASPSLKDISIYFIYSRAFTG